jgi:site-specific recombinase XerD
VATRHSLRHTYATWLFEAGVGEAERAALAGHSERINATVYTDVSADRLRACVLRLPA